MGLFNAHSFSKYFEVTSVFMDKIIASRFLALLKNSSTLEILGDGKQVKSYLDVRDGVKGVLKIPKLHNNKSATYNLGHDETMDVTKLADIVCDEMKLFLSLIHI